MTLETEQVEDLNWAVSVLSGQGDEHDSHSHAEWLIKHLAQKGASDIIRFKARSLSAVRQTI